VGRYEAVTACTVRVLVNTPNPWPTQSVASLFTNQTLPCTTKISNCLTAQHTRPVHHVVCDKDRPAKIGHVGPGTHLLHHRPPRSRAPAQRPRDPDTPQAPTCPHRRRWQRGPLRLRPRAGSARTAHRHLVFGMSRCKRCLTVSHGRGSTKCLFSCPRQATEAACQLAKGNKDEVFVLYTEHSWRGSSKPPCI